MIRWLPSLCLFALLIPLLVAAWRPAPEPTQILQSERRWIPQAGVYPPGLRFTRHPGKLAAIRFEVESPHLFFHGIEVLDDEPYRWNAFGADPVSACDCTDIMSCDGHPDGTWIKARLEVLAGETLLPLGACTDVLPVSVIGAPGPFDGTNDHDGPSGEHRWIESGCSFSTARITDPTILAEFEGEGQESVKLKFHYGATGRRDCPSDGAESFNVDSSYNHYSVGATVRLTYWPAR